MSSDNLDAGPSWHSCTSGEGESTLRMRSHPVFDLALTPVSGSTSIASTPRSKIGSPRSNHTLAAAAASFLLKSSAGNDNNGNMQRCAAPLATIPSQSTTPEQSLGGSHPQAPSPPYPLTPTPRPESVEGPTTATTPDHQTDSLQRLLQAVSNARGLIMLGGGHPTQGSRELLSDPGYATNQAPQQIPHGRSTADDILQGKTSAVQLASTRQHTGPKAQPAPAAQPNMPHRPTLIQDMPSSHQERMQVYSQTLPVDQHFPEGQMSALESRLQALLAKHAATTASQRTGGAGPAHLSLLQRLAPGTSLCPRLVSHPLTTSTTNTGRKSLNSARGRPLADVVGPDVQGPRQLSTGGARPSSAPPVRQQGSVERHVQRLQSKATPERGRHVTAGSPAPRVKPSPQPEARPVSTPWRRANMSPDPRHRKLQASPTSPQAISNNAAALLAARRALAAARQEAERLAAYELLLRRAPPSPISDINAANVTRMPRPVRMPGALPTHQLEAWPAGGDAGTSSSVTAGFTPSPGTQRLIASAVLPNFETRNAALLERRKSYAAEGQLRQEGSHLPPPEPKPCITAAAQGLRRTIQDLDAWDKMRQAHRDSAAHQLAALTRQQEAAVATFMPTINERSRKMAERINSIRSPAERPWNSPSPHRVGARSASRSPIPRTDCLQRTPSPIPARSPATAAVSRSRATTPAINMARPVSAPRVATSVQRSSVTQKVPRPANDLSHTQLTVHAGQDKVAVVKSVAGGRMDVHGVDGAAAGQSESEWELQRLLRQVQDASLTLDHRNSNSYAARYQQVKAHLDSLRAAYDSDSSKASALKAAGGYQVGAFSADPITPPEQMSGGVDADRRSKAPAATTSILPRPAGGYSSHAAAWAAAARAAEVSAAAAVVAATQALTSPPPLTRSLRSPRTQGSPISAATTAPAPLTYATPAPQLHNAATTTTTSAVIPAANGIMATHGTSLSGSVTSILNGNVTLMADGNSASMNGRFATSIMGAATGAALVRTMSKGESKDDHGESKVTYAASFATTTTDVHTVAPATTETAALRPTPPPGSSMPTVIASTTRPGVAYVAPVMTTTFRAAEILTGQQQQQMAAENGYAHAHAASGVHHGTQPSCQMTAAGINKGMAPPSHVPRTSSPIKPSTSDGVWSHLCMAPSAHTTVIPTTTALPTATTASTTVSSGTMLTESARHHASSPRLYLDMSKVSDAGSTDSDGLGNLLSQIERLRELIRKGDMGSGQVVPAWQQLQQHMMNVLNSSTSSAGGASISSGENVVNQGDQPLLGKNPLSQAEGKGEVGGVTKGKGLDGWGLAQSSNPDAITHSNPLAEFSC